MSNELPFQLMAWIKRDQEEREAHKQKMVLRRMRDDGEFIKYLKTLASKWDKLSTKEKLLVQGIYGHHKGSRCLTDTQRSAIIALYLKHAS